MYTVQNYIEKQSKEIDHEKDGYYSDLVKMIESHDFKPTIIGTTNYSKLISQKTDLSEKIIYLNGGIDSFYDPYINEDIKDIEIDVASYKVKYNNNDKHIIIPLLFTQSGTKPITSINMLKSYVNFYDQLKDSEAIVIIGFGFNSDDEHINGIIRTLLDKENKDIYIVDVDSRDEDIKKLELAKKLKVRNKDNLNYITVDSSTRLTDDGIIWYERLFK